MRHIGLVSVPEEVDISLFVRGGMDRFDPRATTCIKNIKTLHEQVRGVRTCSPRQVRGEPRTCSWRDRSQSCTNDERQTSSAVHQRCDAARARAARAHESVCAHAVSRLPASVTRCRLILPSEAVLSLTACNDDREAGRPWATPSRKISDSVLLRRPTVLTDCRRRTVQIAQAAAHFAPLRWIVEPL